MDDITIETILKFIENSKKINDMEQNNKTVYHMRIGLKGMNGPYLDFKYSNSKILGNVDMEVIYGGDSLYKPNNEELKLIKKAIEDRQDALNSDRLEKKKKEFLKIVEEL